MIAILSGKLLQKNPTSSVVDCHGVGYEVLHTPFTAEKLERGSSVTLFIHTHVREDCFQLFGFSEEQERSIFRELLKVSSVGPKLALSILSGIFHKELVAALQNRDIGRLQKIPGIGKKTAERLSIELADRMEKSFVFDLPQDSARDSELESILLNLGYQKPEIQRVLQRVRDQEKDFDDKPIEKMVKISLGELTKINNKNAVRSNS